MKVLDQQVPKKQKANLAVGLGVVIIAIISDAALSILAPSSSLRNDFTVDLAYLTLILTVAGLLLLFSGTRGALASLSMNPDFENPTYRSIVSTVFSTPRFSRLFWLFAAVYCVFFSVASGLLVFQPMSNFSEIYHISIPSVVVATCCGPIGETPQFTAFLTDHLGLAVFPANLFLLFSLSWLVGFNASIVAFAFSVRAKLLGVSWFSGAGAFVGLFAACPTCAGLAILTAVGGTGSLSLAFFLGPFQNLLVSVSLPMLILAPIITARSLRVGLGQDCKVGSLASDRLSD